MEEGNLAVLVDAKTEYTKQLINTIKQNLYFGIKELFLESKDLCNTKETEANTMIIFQNKLSEIPKWNQDIINKECAKIIEDSGCDWLDDLITAVFVSHTRILTSINFAKSKKKINLRIPKIEHFIHQCFVEAGRIFWKNPYLFDDNLNKYDFQRNRRECEQIIEQSINESVRKQLPVKDILKEYLLKDPEEEIPTENNNDDNNDESNNIDSNNESDSFKDNLRQMVKDELKQVSEEKKLESQENLVSEILETNDLTDTKENKTDDNMKNIDMSIEELPKQLENLTDIEEVKLDNNDTLKENNSLELIETSTKEESNNDSFDLSSLEPKKIDDTSNNINNNINNAINLDNKQVNLETVDTTNNDENNDEIKSVENDNSLQEIKEIKLDSEPVVNKPIIEDNIGVVVNNTQKEIIPIVKEELNLDNLIEKESAGLEIETLDLDNMDDLSQLKEVYLDEPVNNINNNNNVNLDNSSNLNTEINSQNNVSFSDATSVPIIEKSLDVKIEPKSESMLSNETDKEEIPQDNNIKKIVIESEKPDKSDEHKYNVLKKYVRKTDDYDFFKDASNNE